MVNINTNGIEEAKRIFSIQKEGYNKSHIVSYDSRIDRINRIENMIRDNRDEIAKAIEADFGTRNSDYVFIADIYPVLSHAKHVKKHLRKWMKREKTSTILEGFIGQKTYIINEPMGVVGVMSPFNAPVSLAFDPAIEALAAGNRVMIKFSESTPNTASLMKGLVSKYFKEEELAVVTGDLEVSKVFSALPWDKFFFTGGSEVGKKILEAASNNLTPVILELGGKSPCVVLEDADLDLAAEKIAKVRLMNSGQVCISGDYVLIPDNKLEKFLKKVVESAESVYPKVLDNPDYVSIINDREYERIISYIDEAKASGCKLIQVNPGNEELPNKEKRKIPLTIAINPDKNLKLAQNEIFGPILTIFTYDKLDDAIASINEREKALALYIFGKNNSDINKVVNQTSSGGVTINDMLLHAGSNTMGFGGVGYSGMGRYKGGFIGYQAFTNPKAVYQQGILRKFTTSFLPPSKNQRMTKMLKAQVGIK
ncbi:MAG: aldehyde dehydrogenase family protein [Firmicutes bacterium]|jgi:coniferyl-aldehyde dehydrogenase|nr:aldehyde dehydrogenase family protein [Bacillota bacterium]